MSTSSSQDRYSNLLAAKSALGLSFSSTSTSTPSPSSNASSATSGLSTPVSGAASLISRESKITPVVRDKRSSLHDLSASARQEARRFLDTESSLDSISRLSPYSSRTTATNESLSTRRSAAMASHTALSPLKGGAHSISSSSISGTIDEGSRDDSMAALMEATSPVVSPVVNRNVAARNPGDRKIQRYELELSSDSFLTEGQFGMSSSFNNCYEKKASFNGFRGNCTANEQDVEDDDTADDTSAPLRLTNGNPRAHHNDSFAGSIEDFSNSHRSLVSTDSTFVPQRFDEMRSLLLNITPLQLEALVHEILFSPNNSSGSGSNFSGNVPKEWRDIRKKSKQYNFRKDAYLGEMSFNELYNFAQSIELWNVIDNDCCTSHDIAMDLFAIEFERLVSGQQSSSMSSNLAGGDDSSSNSNIRSQNRFEDDLLSYASNNSQEEGESLHLSLRACSVPELKLVAERLNLDYLSCGNNKSSLIILIESSMPDVLAINDAHHFNQHQNQQLRQSEHRQYRASNSEDAAIYVEESHARHQEDLERAKRVKFSTDCKEDKSHLIPKREVNQAVWGNYVVDSENGEVMASSQPLVNDSDEEKYDDEFIFKRSKLGKMWPQQRRRLVRVGFVVSVVVGVALGLGFGLTTERPDDSSSSSASVMTGPWNMQYTDLYEKSEQPSITPTAVKVAVVVLPTPSTMSASPTSKPTPNATQMILDAISSSTEPSESNSIELPVSTNFMPESSLSNSTLSSTELTSSVSNTTTQNMSTSPTESMNSTLNPTLTPTRAQIAPSAPTSSPTDVMTTNTTQPSTYSTESIYPLLGPFDEAGMRMILHGLTELSSMGQTQWRMLTSAWVEQFYNHGEKGDDAIQNIVFDVVSNIEITHAEQLASSMRRLQDGSLAVTFTMTISYHTFSTFVSADTVADRPFSEDSMRLGYVQYLIENNAMSFIGKVTSISSIFRGDEIPNDFILPAENESTATKPSNPAKSPHPSGSLETPVPSTLELAQSSTEAPSVLSLMPSLPNQTVTSSPFGDEPDESDMTLYPMQSLTPSASIETLIPSSSNTASPSSEEASVLTPRPTLSADTVTSSPSYDQQMETPNPSGSLKTAAPSTTSPTLSEEGSELTPRPTFPSGSSSPSVSLNTSTFLETQTPSPLTTSPPTAENDSTVTSISSSPTRTVTSSPSIKFTSIALSPTESSTVGILETFSPVISSEAIYTFSPVDENSISSVPTNDAYDLSETFSPVDDNFITTIPTNVAYDSSEQTASPQLSSSPVDDNFLTLIPTNNAYHTSETASPQPTIGLDSHSTPFPTEIATNSNIFTSSPITTRPVKSSSRKKRPAQPISQPTNREKKTAPPTASPTSPPTLNPTLSPTISPSSNPVSSPILCDVVTDRECSGLKETLWDGDFEIGQTHVVRAVNESRRAPRIIANREAELLFTPGTNYRQGHRIFSPHNTSIVRLSVYSASGRLIGITDVRDPSRQRKIFENKVSQTKIDPYSDTAWSATLPFNWVDEGITLIISCVDDSLPTEVLINRLELKSLAQFSQHSITRTKMAIFGSEEDVRKLNTKTFDGKKLVRNLFSVIPVAELLWSDTDLWHLPYLVVMGKEGPALVNSEEERRSVTGEGTEISWSVMKNYLTIRHALAQAGLGFSETSEDVENSPYTSGTSVFMGWSLSKQDGDSWIWDELGYWDTLAAAAWTGWIAMKAGDECSNYFIHELGHAQSMQHFDSGNALKWGIEDEYPNDGVYTPELPWGYDSVAREFRTWFDPLDGTGKKDPLNSEGEPPYSQELNCYSQYTPYQALISQDWAMSHPILLSASTSNVPLDGAYTFDANSCQYMSLVGSELTVAVGENAMTPDQVSIPVITLIGTIGALRDVCQTYPALRGYGNTFSLSDPLDPGLPIVYHGANYFVEVRFEDGQKKRGLIAVNATMDEKSLYFFSFNVAIERRPIAVDLYRFSDSTYPGVTPHSDSELLHIRPIEFPPEDPLYGMSPQLRVGRGWLGDSSDIVIDSFCLSSHECNSEKYSIEWRGNVGSDNVIYRSTVEGRNDDALKTTTFQVPVFRQRDSTEYSITVIAARFFNDEQGMSPLLTSNPLKGNDSSNIDVTNMIRIWAPWELNDSLPVGLYRSLSGVFKISAESKDSSSTNAQRLIELQVTLFIGTVTASPTPAPTKRPSVGPTPSPVPVHFHIDWKVGTCVTDGTSSEWAPPYQTKHECCQNHMAYEFSLCISRTG